MDIPMRNTILDAFNLKSLGRRPRSGSSYVLVPAVASDCASRLEFIREVGSNEFPTRALSLHPYLRLYAKP